MPTLIIGVTCRLIASGKKLANRKIDYFKRLPFMCGSNYISSKFQNFAFTDEREKNSTT